MKAKFAELIATCFYAGRSPIAPGTLGTLAALPVIWMLRERPLILPAIWLAITILGIWAGGEVAHLTGRKDPQTVVIDEISGMMASVLFVPIRAETLLAGFIAFRFFDTLKPPPIRLLERLPGGWGIVLDDVMAGVYVNLLLQLGIGYAHL